MIVRNISVVSGHKIKEAEAFEFINITKVRTDFKEFMRTDCAENLTLWTSGLKIVCCYLFIINNNNNRIFFIVINMDSILQLMCMCR